MVSDPFYDIATHFHKMQYIPLQESLFLEHYLGQNRDTMFFKDSWDQIQIYLQLEKIKSAIVDIVRISEKFKIESSEKKRIFLAEQYRLILRKAWVVWEKEIDQILSSNEICSILSL